MEPRINHRQPGWLGDWFQDHCYQGFDAPTARCLYLRMYYSFDDTREVQNVGSNVFSA